MCILNMNVQGTEFFGNITERLEVSIVIASRKNIQNKFKPVR